MPTYNKLYYQEYVGEDRTEELLEDLRKDLNQYLSVHHVEKIQKTHDDILMLKGRWERVERKDNLGIDDDKESEKEINRITYSLLEIINDLPSYFFDFMNGNKNAKPSIQHVKKEVEQKTIPKKEISPSKTNWTKIVGLVVLLALLGIGLKYFLGKGGIRNNNDDIKTTTKIEKEEPENNIKEKKGTLPKDKESDTKIIEDDKHVKPLVINSLEMVDIPGGTFTMGCEEMRDRNCQSNWIAIEGVNVAPFKMGKFEVTQKLWQEIMKENRSHFKDCDLCPVETVTWKDVQMFIKKLNSKTGKKYRLPSEAEWEYAARSNSDLMYSGSDDIDEVAWYSDSADKETHPVGSKKPNAFGLYDMTGNVTEWCQDTWHNKIDDIPKNGKAWETGGSTGRVTKGGSWYKIKRYQAVHYRTSRSEIFRNNMIGFRLAHD